MKSTITLSVFIILCCTYSLSQVNNTEILDYNNVATMVGDEGTMCYNAPLGMAEYEIPKGSGKNTLFYITYWFGALDVNLNPNVTADIYGASGNYVTPLRSGPIANQFEYTSADYTNQYLSSIWSVKKQEIDNHILNYSSPGYVIPTSISEWPGNGDVSLGVASQLAPYVDVNSDLIYNPADGDYPDIRGDQAVYVIMNDESSGITPMRIEVHLMVYQYSSGGYINNTTFLNFRVFNRGTSNYTNYKQTIYLDPDIGFYDDDFIGCDSTNSVAFAYNGDDFDENDGGNIGYGANPPCQGIVCLSHSMESFGYFTNGGSYPHEDYGLDESEIWNLMNAKWVDGSPWTYGGQGFGIGSTNPSNYMFSGNPNNPAGWSEVSETNPPGDRRMIMTIGAADFPVNSSICSDYALIYDKTSTNLGNVQNVINIAASLRYLYENEDGFPCQSEAFNLLNEPEELNFDLFPNPNGGSFSINLPGSSNEAIIVIHDLMGRKVHYRAEENSSKIDIQMDNLPGVYFVTVAQNNSNSTKKIVVR